MAFRYDSHLCGHELIHRKWVEDENYEESHHTVSWLTEQISHLTEIDTEVNYLTLPNMCGHLLMICQDFPHIKRVNLILTDNSNLLPHFSTQDRIDKFNKCIETTHAFNFDIHIEDESLWHLFTLPIPEAVTWKIFDKLGELYWVTENYDAEYILKDNFYYHYWFKPLNTHNPDITWDLFKQKIKDNLKLNKTRSLLDKK